MPLIRSVSDRLVALELGQVVAEGTPDAVIHDPRVVEGYLGGTLEVIERSGGGGAPTAAEKAAAKPAKKATRKVTAKKTTNGNGAARKAAPRKTPQKKVGV
jgi:ABC-type glutathione transport system ATPase component